MFRLQVTSRRARLPRCAAASVQLSAQPRAALKVSSCVNPAFCVVAVTASLLSAACCRGATASVNTKRSPAASWKHVHDRLGVLIRTQSHCLSMLQLNMSLHSFFLRRGRTCWLRCPSWRPPFNRSGWMPASPLRQRVRQRTFSRAVFLAGPVGHPYAPSPAPNQSCGQCGIENRQLRM